MNQKTKQGNFEIANSFPDNSKNKLDNYYKGVCLL